MPTMKLRFLGGRYQGRIVDLKPEGFTIGRGRDNDLVLDTDGISRRHCRMGQEGEGWVIEDLQSTNGVRVNSQRVQEKQLLKSGDRIGISNELLLFTDANEIVDPEPGEDADEESAEEQYSFPWFRSALLVLVVLLIAWLLYSMNKAEKVEEPVPVVAGNEQIDAASDPVSEVTDMSDAELAELMADVEGEASAQNISPVEQQVDSTAVEGNRQTIRAATPVPAQPQAAPQATAVPFAVHSQPSGAEVVIDGKSHGETPLLLNDVSLGRHRIELRKAGYEALSRQIHMPDALPDEAYVLHQKPGTFMLTSDPSGATIWLGTQILGRTPMLLESLPAGEHELRLQAAGHETQAVTIEVSDLRGEEKHVQLTSLLGSLEVTTVPANCRIIVDTHVKGITEVGDEKRRLSKPFRIAGLLEGKHVLRVEHPNGNAKTGKVVVQRGKVTPVPVKLWIIDTKIVLNNGTVKYGMLIEKNEYGDVVLAESPQEMERYLAPQLEEVEELSAEEARRILQEDDEQKDNVRNKARTGEGEVSGAGEDF